MRDINKLSIAGRTWDFIGSRNFAPRAIAAAGIGMARSLGPLGIGMTLAPLVWDAIRQEWMMQDTGPGELQNAVSGALIKQCGWYAKSQTAQYDACIAAALQYWADTGRTYIGYVLSQHPDPSSFHPLWTGYACSAVTVYDAATNACVTGTPQPQERPATDQEIEDAIYAELVARGMGSELARRLIEAGYDIPVDSIGADGPTSIPGETTTTTRQNGDGTTTNITTNTTHNVTYNTNTTNNTTTVTITNNTTTTTTNPDGTTTTETKVETPAEGGEETQEQQYTLTYSPSAMPEVPDFYEQKYPDGFAGAWNDFKGRVTASSLAGFINGIGAGLPGGGTCPSWSMSLNMGAMGNFGTFVLEPPCVIWPFIKAVMILSALFVARRLVVGG